MRSLKASFLSLFVLAMVDNGCVSPSTCNGCLSFFCLIRNYERNGQSNTDPCVGFFSRPTVGRFVLATRNGFVDELPYTSGMSPAWAFFCVLFPRVCTSFHYICQSCFHPYPPVALRFCRLHSRCRRHPSGLVCGIHFVHLCRSPCWGVLGGLVSHQFPLVCTVV